MDHPRKEWLLCFDFDGTLIDPKKSQEIDPSLQKALSLIREKNECKNSKKICKKEVGEIYVKEKFGYKIFYKIK